MLFSHLRRSAAFDRAFLVVSAHLILLRGFDDGLNLRL